MTNNNGAAQLILLEEHIAAHQSLDPESDLKAYRWVRVVASSIDCDTNDQQYSQLIKPIWSAKAILSSLMPIDTTVLWFRRPPIKAVFRITNIFLRVTW